MSSGVEAIAVSAIKKIGLPVLSRWRGEAGLSGIDNASTTGPFRQRCERFFRLKGRFYQPRPQAWGSTRMMEAAL